MIYNKKVLSIIPARAGSKGLPGKNKKLLAGKPLLAWSIDVAKKSKYIDDIVVSTDGYNLAMIARDYGASVPFMRPSFLATDDSPSIDAVIHCLNSLSSTYDIVVILQPTTPLRSDETIDECIKVCFESNKSVVTVSPSKKPIEWMFHRTASGLKYVQEGEKIPTRRQDCKPVFSVDGNVYCLPREHLEPGGELFTRNSHTIVSKEEERVDIDTLDDFMFCEYLIKRVNKNDN